MSRLVRSLLFALAVVGPASLAPALIPASFAQNGAGQSAFPPPPANFPSNLRWDLTPKWIQWAEAKTQISWPPNDGCAAAPETRTLAAGELIDRFGSEGGSFFSPKGESFEARAVPYICSRMDYRVYRVLKPISVKACKAAPWFDEPGGAIQVQSADPAFKLRETGVIQVVTYDVGGSGQPNPQCGGP